MAQPRERLRQLGLQLPTPPAPLASYVPTRTVPMGGGKALVFVAGQVPLEDGQLRFIGRVPTEVSLEDAQAAARLCALNILAQVEAAAGLDKVDVVASVTGFVRSAEGFGEQPQVINAASDLLADVLGDAGRHSRAAVGVSELPRGVSVEIAAVFVVRT
ncbi:MAG: RidA family protein [Chloroflexi bacterium]|nr:MAG: RidA family protein [Chloroflexota bacterium]TME17599.1 MAG: RidA family protein [Chloroflexota bacterium]